MRTSQPVKTRCSQPLDLSKVKGNHPYKKITGEPLHPSTDKNKCSRCGKCADECNTHSIDSVNCNVFRSVIISNYVLYLILWT